MSCRHARWIEEFDLRTRYIQQRGLLFVGRVFDVFGEKSTHRGTSGVFVLGDVLEKATFASGRPDHKNLA